MLIYDNNRLQFIEVENNYKKPFYILLLICFLLTVSVSMSFHLLYQQNIELNIKTTERIDFEIHNLNTLKKVDSFIDILPFKDKNLIKRQYRLESGNLKSDLTRKNNNIFGMRGSKRRHTYIGICENNYAIYSNIQMSVLDRLMYEIYVNNLKTYAEDKNYLTKLKIK